MGGEGEKHLHFPAAVASLLATLANPNMGARKNAFATASHRFVRSSPSRERHEREHHRAPHS